LGNYFFKGVKNTYLPCIINKSDKFNLFASDFIADLMYANDVISELNFLLLNSAIASSKFLSNFCTNRIKANSSL